MKGVDSHGSCKTHYKDSVIASAYKPDNRTAGGHVHYMAVFHILSGIICITAILGYGFGQETGTETIRMLVAGFVLYVLPIIASWFVVWLEVIKIRLMGD